MLIRYSFFVALSALNVSVYALEGIRFEYKDWYLACDNSGTCRAAGYSPENGDVSSAMAVMFTREAGADAKVKGKIFLDEKANDFDSLKLIINKKNWGNVVSDGTLRPVQVKALLDALPKSSVGIMFKDESKTWNLSDQGASAVFRKMDDFQQRLNTPSALVVKGNLPLNQLLSPQPIPKVKPVETRDEQTKEVELNSPLYHSLLKELIKNTDKKDCDVENYAAYKDSFFSRMEIAELSHSQSIVKMLCWHGAYNHGYGVWLINSHQPYNPRLITDTATDYQNGKLSSTHKGRGLGDCIDHKEWVFTEGSFKLTQAYDTGLCRSVAGGGIDPIYTFVSEVLKN